MLDHKVCSLVSSCNFYFHVFFTRKFLWLASSFHKLEYACYCPGLKLVRRLMANPTMSLDREYMQIVLLIIYYLLKSYNVCTPQLHVEFQETSPRGMPLVNPSTFLDPMKDIESFSLYQWIMFSIYIILPFSICMFVLVSILINMNAYLCQQNSDYVNIDSTCCAYDCLSCPFVRESFI